MNGCICMSVLAYMCACGLVCVFGRQVPMVGKGVVEAILATLSAVQGADAQALSVHVAACETLASLSAAADNKVRLRG